MIGTDLATVERSAPLGGVISGHATARAAVTAALGTDGVFFGHTCRIFREWILNKGDN